MPRENFNELLVFLAVAEERSFTKAAAKLGTSQSTLSHTVKKLEERLGMRLLTRTTRSVGLTEAGERLQQSLSPRIAEIEADIEALTVYRERPAGTVKITLSNHAMESVVWPKLSSILSDYPDIKFELSVDGSFRNIVEDGFDAGVRLGESLEKDMIAVRIGPDWRLVAVGSPAYFKARPVPLTPQELMRHNCIRRRLDRIGGLYAWEFEKDGEEIRVRVEGQLTLNTDREMISAALDGHGIAYVPESYVEDHLEAGRLQLVLDDWCPKFAGYYLYYPSRRQNLRAFSVVIDALRERS
ncbi:MULTISPECIES: LysR family transcriptional regulator [unclassified Rhizobium]|jgi:DNA-binding transcriptional LysR family regulator|uniref:LysR family transcriptional regulator n=1 Tax=unclassified Rhizobium TaxID=2613769 RepID=UPI0006482FC7|nr:MULTISPECIES: LysR family transcriptional regulator [unclassified Rhizobium]MBN8954346.1 LysR family transcriptional regulator [Rhizobium tropici]OJY79106.1 MAG: LysR family transcriptional regulator [Rhizobium sp. 60-20]RKD67847.1 LysR family transcriptional regulator [Rhizobium sp. WW_1]